MLYQSMNPYTGEVLHTFNNATSAEIEDTLATAHAAFLGWREEPVAERAALLGRAAAQLRSNSRHYAELLTLEMGKLIGEAETEVELSARILEHYASFGPDHLAPRQLRAEGFNGTDITLVTEPLGVLYAIKSWNFPLYQVIRFSAPQLMAGNTIVLKHSVNVPQSALAMQQLYRDAGATEGLFTNIFASHEATDLILSDPRVRGVSMTGSARAGAAVAATAAENLKKSILEPGGADAFVVLEDVDVAAAARWAASGRHWNVGRACTSAKRLIVVEEVAETFLAEYRSRVAGLVSGDPMDPATTLAPLASRKVAEKLSTQVEMARAEGVTVETTGAEVPAAGTFFHPVLLHNVPLDSRTARTEFLGPVSQFHRARDAEDAVRIANSSSFGLGGSIFAGDGRRAQNLARHIGTGMVYLEPSTGGAVDLPFSGGGRGSGHGHGLVDLGIKEFVNQKVVAARDLAGAL